ncbi:SDR family oxidoreductase [Rathayibacter sp. VKM Ac-2804]|uniref:SDR family NAD(P)-dependent oxidoreductase n=1 Tax=Rathayibacter sp. VKM Ac-2804 TaxID=2609257 RepID=UPI00132F4168|nr:SDR family NAD(P)-dependent oxidoreductase [Rathayibacter sp. VKM Ac-2804]QHF25676.1 SDR family oxidoreductase [Rathayibacter sp. VKM Ac-2804]
MSAFARYPSLDGRTVIVTGGASGLGAEFVRQFAAQGARVGFLDIDAEQGGALARELGDAVRFVRCDVRDVAALEAAIEGLAAELGPAHVLVNNAANDARHTVEDLDPAYWDDRMAVNLRHQFFAARLVSRGMLRAGAGSIINLGSISAHIDLVELVGYITAKAAIEGMTRALARELGAGGIRVNCVIPGWIMTERQLQQVVTPEAERQIDRSQCLPGRLVPADVARLVLWLAADDSAMCTAQNWVVDGGWL